MEEVFRKLFGKAKSQTKRASSPEAEPTTTEPEVSRSQDEEPNAVTGRVKKIETADPTRIGDDESTATDSTRPQEQPAQEAEIAGGEEDTKSQEETGEGIPEQVQPENMAGASENAFVIHIKDRRVKQHLQYLMQAAREDLRERGWTYIAGLPKEILELVKQEDALVQVLVELLQDHFG
jgi:hypothetical protein